MKRTTRISLLFLLLSLFSLSLRATEPDARYLSLEVRYTLQNDGSWTQDVSRSIKLLSSASFNDLFGESFLLYNPNFQKLTILKSQTTMADGTKVETPKNGYIDQLPFEAHGFADFSQLREMVVSHTGLEIGAVIDLSYRIETSAGFLPYFTVQESLAYSMPVESLTVLFDTPREIALKLNTSLGEVSRTERGDRILYSLKLKDLPPTPYEGSVSGGRPLIVASTAPDTKTALVPFLTIGDIGPSLKREAERLLTENSSPQDCLLALQSWIDSRLQTAPLSPALCGLPRQDAERIWSSGYGTPWEKRALFLKMAETMKLPHKLFFCEEFAGFEKAPTFLAAEKLLLRSSGDDPLYIDPLSSSSPLFPSGKGGLRLIDPYTGSAETLPPERPQDNALVVSGTGSWSPTMSDLSLKVSLSGEWLDYRTARKDAKEAVRKALANIIPGFQCETLNLTRLTPRSLEGTVTAKASLAKENTPRNYLWEIPSPNQGLSLIAPPTRALPLSLTPTLLNFSVTLNLPKGSLPLMTLQERSGKKWRYSLKQEGERLLWEVSWAQEDSLVTPQGYKLFRELWLPLYSLKRAALIRLPE